MSDNSKYSPTEANERKNSEQNSISLQELMGLRTFVHPVGKGFKVPISVDLMFAVSPLTKKKSRIIGYPTSFSLKLYIKF